MRLINNKKKLKFINNIKKYNKILNNIKNKLNSKKKIIFLNQRQN